MSKSISIRGSVSNEGKIKILNSDLLHKWAADNKGKNILIEVEVRTNKRSNPQNSYYWGVVVDMVHKGMVEYGNDFSKQETHEFLKARFNYKDVELLEGHYIEVPQSTTRLDTVGFNEYIIKIQQFASDMLAIIIPDPNQSEIF